MEMYWEGPKYADRHEAGLVLAKKLASFEWTHPLVLAIPNGGVAVALPISQELDCTLEVIVVRKLQIPERPEAGFGAVAFDGSVILNIPLVRRLALSDEVIANQRERALASIRKRLALYGSREFPELQGRTVILVDDGLASGFTMEAAVKVVKKHEPTMVVVAIPTSSMSAYRRLADLVDRIVCPDVSRLPIFAVADAYKDWCDLADEEVMAMLQDFRPDFP
jgi:predicted phosphoribosyltransferase